MIDVAQAINGKTENGITRLSRILVRIQDAATGA